MFVLSCNSDDGCIEKKLIPENGSISIRYDPYFSRFGYFSKKKFDRNDKD